MAPRFTREANGEGIDNYASFMRWPQHADDLPGWRACLDGKVFKVTMATALVEAGCCSATIVPLLEDDRDGPFDVVVLHYDQKRSRGHSDETLLLLGRVSAQFIASADRAQNERIRSRLNALAEGHLDFDQRPEGSRNEYLRDLIRHLREVLHCAGVSVFLKEPFGEHVYCVASSGLQDAQDCSVPRAKLPTIKYGPGEGLTGYVVEQRRPLMSPHSLVQPGHVPRSRESRQARDGNQVESILICPILGIKPDKEGKRPLIGLIRASDHESPLLGHVVSHFQTSDLRAVEYVAEQISPVLQTFQHRIEREDAISLVKHDISTPLQMVRDKMLEIAERIAVPGSPLELPVSNALSCTLSCLKLVEALELKPPGEEDMRVEETRLEGDIIARVKAMLSNFARTENSMSIQFAPGIRELPPMMLDPNLIERVIVNLIVNAVKYGLEGSTIMIESRPVNSNPRYFVLDVSNLGQGIDDDEKERIFEARYRGRRAAETAGPGAGLGLAISRHIMQLHGGRLDVTSLRGPTTFSVYFPRSAVIRGTRHHVPPIARSGGEGE
ncbi:MAG: GAF domain-containing sensor histidine kinase [Planctomycetes bacterium]|nr:GAF domain-containing sensor histidine kinase [Planctomycetota bacterium]